jgi:hypothetical protein
MFGTGFELPTMISIVAESLFAPGRSSESVTVSVALNVHGSFAVHSFPAASAE